MTKVAISSLGPTLDDDVDARFGRAAGYVLVDPESMETEYLDNGSSQVLAQGAGIQAAQNVVNAGAGVVLTGFVGPKAYQVLEAAGVKIGQDLGGRTVREALEAYTSGNVVLANAPNSGGHGR